MRGRLATVYLAGGLLLALGVSACGQVEEMADEAATTSEVSEASSGTGTSGAADSGDIGSGETNDAASEADGEVDGTNGEADSPANESTTTSEAPAEANTTPDTPVQLTYEIVATYPHDTTWFTQGLLYFNGSIYESTGLVGQSTLRQLDLSELSRLAAADTANTASTASAVKTEVRANEAHFGEGLARVDDELTWLTWRAGVATTYDLDTFTPLRAANYMGQGWGLCYLGEFGGPVGHADGSAADDQARQDLLALQNRLVMSDGSDVLTFRSTSSFAYINNVVVGIERLNELECVNGLVWANVWQTDRILVIDPISGDVVAEADMAGLLSPSPADANSDAVLNGIAYRPDTDTYFITGKLWPTMFEVRFDTDAIARNGG